MCVLVCIVQKIIMKIVLMIFMAFLGLFMNQEQFRISQSLFRLMKIKVQSHTQLGRVYNRFNNHGFAAVPFSRSG